MNLTEQKVNEYAELISSPESEVLYRLTRETNLKVMNPIMLCGHLQGKLLQMITSMLKPQHVLEIGTYTGYSAICIASGLPENGRLTTIEINPELEDICRKYFSESRMDKKIELIIGDGLSIVPSFEKKFDLAYIDCDKDIYLPVYEMVIEKVVSGGFIIADNVLWHGKIIDTKEQNDRETIAIREFNQHIKNDKRVTNLLLPFRDGLMLIQKK